jgi:hypothetical protein
VLKRGGRAGLGLESRSELLLRDFQRDDAVESCIAGAVDNAHAAFAEFREDFIRTETGTGGVSAHVRIIGEAAVAVAADGSLEHLDISILTSRHQNTSIRSCGPR